MFPPSSPLQQHRRRDFSRTTIDCDESQMGLGGYHSHLLVSGLCHWRRYSRFFWIYGRCFCRLYLAIFVHIPSILASRIQHQEECTSLDRGLRSRHWQHCPPRHGQDTPFPRVFGRQLVSQRLECDLLSRISCHHRPRTVGRYQKFNSYIFYPRAQCFWLQVSSRRVFLMLWNDTRRGRRGLVLD